MHSPQPFLLIGITPAPFEPTQQKLVNRLFGQGLDYLYIRSGEKDAASWEQVLEQIDPVFHSRLLLPANAPVEAAGGQYIRHIREAERLQGQSQLPEPGKLYSTSVHHLHQVQGLGDRYNLAFYSPVFPSISKAGYRPQLSWVDLLRQMAGLPQEGRPRLIGLGGISAANIGQVQAAGFAGAALLGALWQAPCPERALAEIQAQIRIARR
jgi:thiamine-phosphate pyrophosphorylase